MGKRFELPPEWNIYSALTARDALLAWVSEQSAKGADHLEISAGKVAEIDGAGLQLLAALGNHEIPWRLVDASDTFVQACSAMGFDTWLESLETKPSGA